MHIYGMIFILAYMIITVCPTCECNGDIEHTRRGMYTVPCTLYTLCSLYIVCTMCTTCDMKCGLVNYVNVYYPVLSRTIPHYPVLSRTIPYYPARYRCSAVSLVVPVWW